ncbi:hypothetical protein Q5P01_007894 [Channa striata]|uniref:Uncharacterized protein n=1 Tax=Channa striata TaxID=64152 RepID=A0AA88N7F6_CHASR|nr:hypothetical protein Q5P01_007894 [Channa striata]
MAAAALQFCIVSDHLARTSSHIPPAVKSGTFLGHHAWLVLNKKNRSEDAPILPEIQSQDSNFVLSLPSGAQRRCGINLCKAKRH